MKISLLYLIDYCLQTVLVNYYYYYTTIYLSRCIAFR